MTRIRLALVVCAFGLVACGGDRYPNPQTAASRPSTPAPAQPAQGAAPAPLNLSNDILAVCKIEVSDPANAPKFDMDSTAVTAEEKTILQQLATCMTTGPLKGKNIVLTGRADPRGEKEYNMVLGAGRAKNVSMYLTQLGVDAHRLKETSRGEMDATGSDEEGWRKDRRVDISVAP